MKVGVKALDKKTGGRNTDVYDRLITKYKLKERLSKPILPYRVVALATAHFFKGIGKKLWNWQTEPKLCAFIFASPHSEDFLLSVHIDSDCDIYSLFDNLPFASDVEVYSSDEVRPGAVAYLHRQGQKPKHINNEHFLRFSAYHNMRLGT